MFFSLPVRRAVDCGADVHYGQYNMVVTVVERTELRAVKTAVVIAEKQSKPQLFGDSPFSRGDSPLGVCDDRVNELQRSSNQSSRIPSAPSPSLVKHL